MSNIVVLGLGNELLADDSVGILAVRRLKKEINGDVSLVECSLVGMALLDQLVGCEKAVIIDAIQSGEYPTGTVLELNAEDLRAVRAPSSHYSGLPEIIATASELDLPFPSQIKIVAVEIADAVTLGGDMSASVTSALDEVVLRVNRLVCDWQKEMCLA